MKKFIDSQGEEKTPQLPKKGLATISGLFRSFSKESIFGKNSPPPASNETELPDWPIEEIQETPLTPPSSRPLPIPRTKSKETVWEEFKSRYSSEEKNPSWSSNHTSSHSLTTPPSSPVIKHDSPTSLLLSDLFETDTTLDKSRVKYQPSLWRKTREYQAALSLCLGEEKNHNSASPALNPVFKKQS